VPLCELTYAEAKERLAGAFQEAGIIPGYLRDDHADALAGLAIELLVGGEEAWTNVG
jgi:hypothetical protein